MSEMMTYAAQTVVCSALFTVFYRVVLQGRTSFRTARRYLLATPVVAAVIPALDIPLWRVAPIEVPFVASVFDGVALPASAPVAAPVDWASIALWVLWGVGIAMLALTMVRQMVRIAAIRRRAEIHPADGFRVAVSGEVRSPFSFLGTVFVGRETPVGEIRQIMTHEASHIRHRHSAEKLAMEGLKSLQWFNPFVWWAARLLGEIHEFEADRDVLDGGSTVEEYLPLILRQTFGCVPELTVGLGDSLTKKRFLMMKNMIKPARNSWLRVAGVLPLAAGAMMLFSFTSRPPEIVYTEVPEVVAAPVVAAAEVADATPAAIPVTAPAPESAPESARQAPRSTQPGQTDPDAPLLIAEVMPTFEGGDLSAFLNWVLSRVNYPREAREKGISGTVAVKYVVERDGSVSNIEVLNSPDASLSAEVARVIGLSPKWTLAMQNGSPARIQYILPVRFDAAENSVPPVQPDMGDVRVIGYGVQRKPDADQVTIRAEEASLRAEVATLRAEVARLRIERARMLRGEASLRADTVKMVLDGRFTQGNPMVMVNGVVVDGFHSVVVTDIASVDVIKDETALEQYGDRGKYGVIMVTTKR